MATEFIKLDNTILNVIKKIKNQHQQAGTRRNQFNWFVYGQGNIKNAVGWSAE